jgi:hypothetical protein
MTTAKVYEQSVAVYKAMSEQARDGVYKGYITYLFSRLGFEFGAYTSVMRRLVAMGCIEQLVAGGRNNPSEWKLVTEPTEELFAQHSGRRKSRLAAVEAQNKELTNRVEALEEIVHDVIDERAS